MKQKIDAGDVIKELRGALRKKPTPYGGHTIPRTTIEEALRLVTEVEQLVTELEQLRAENLEIRNRINLARGALESPKR